MRNTYIIYLFLLLSACTAERPAGAESFMGASLMNAADAPQARSKAFGSAAFESGAFESEAFESEAFESGAATPALTSSQDLGQTEQKRIKEGYITFETKNLDKTRQTIIAAVQKHKGYISSDREYSSNATSDYPENNRTSNTLIIRVPATNFDALLNDATQGIESFDEKQSNVRDVTEEYLDIQARLKVKRELESRYLDLLTRAEKVSEILEIETQIGALRAEIESTEGRLRYLQNRISLSTLTITYYQNLSDPADEANIWKQLADGFKSGIDNLMLFLILLDHIWPFILIALIVILGVHSYKRKKQKKKKSLRKRSNPEESLHDKS